MYVYGHVIDQETRCRHYFGSNDIIAIKFKCCNTYYPCYKCHDAFEDHAIEPWRKEEYSTKAILCGKCHREMTIQAYITTGECTHCHALFNEGCKKHYSIYFETT